MCHPQQKLPYQNDISLIVSSPLRRTLYTAILGFAPALANGHCQPNVIALPELQETSQNICDIGSDLDKLRDEIKEKRLPVDLSLVPERWNIKTDDSKWAANAPALAKRAKEARIYLRDKALELQKGGEKDPQIVILTHGGYLHYLTEDWEGSENYHGKPRSPPSAKSASGELGHSLFSILISWILLVTAFIRSQIERFPWHAPGTGWNNAEYRSFTFANLDPSNPSNTFSTTINGTQIPGHITVNDYENATMSETAKSRARRGKSEPQAPRNMQSELFNAAIQGSKAQAQPDAIQVAKTKEDAVGVKVEENDDDEDDDDDENDDQGGLVRVWTNDSDNTEMKNGKAPATDRRGESAVDATAAAARDRKSSSVTAVAA